MRRSCIINLNEFKTLTLTLTCYVVLQLQILIFSMIQLLQIQIIQWEEPNSMLTKYEILF